MATIVSTVHTDSEAFSENRDRMLGFVDQLRRYEQRTEETSNRRLKTFRARNQLTPKERLDALNPKERVELLIKLMPYVLPKVTNVSHTTNEPLDWG